MIARRSESQASKLGFRTAGPVTMTPVCAYARRAGEPDLLAYCPKQWRAVLDLNLVILTVLLAVR
jgi:hypothetical protein